MTPVASLYDFVSLKTDVLSIMDSLVVSDVVLLSVLCNAIMIVTQLRKAAACQNRHCVFRV